MEEKTIVIETQAFAYYFLHHHINKSLSSIFDRSEINELLSGFCKFLQNDGYIPVSKNGESLKFLDVQKKLVDDIIYNNTFVYHEGIGNILYCFIPEIIQSMSSQFLNGDKVFKDKVLEYELEMTQKAFSNVFVMRDNDQIYKNFAEKNRKKVMPQKEEIHEA